VRMYSYPLKACVTVLGWLGGLCVTVPCQGVAGQLCLSETIRSLAWPPCALSAPMTHPRTTVVYLSNLFLLLPDVAHNLQDTLRVGQPGHISWQSLQL
jgi:hypothetical protein